MCQLYCIKSKRIQTISAYYLCISLFFKATTLKLHSFGESKGGTLRSKNYLLIKKEYIRPFKNLAHTLNRGQPRFCFKRLTKNFFITKEAS